MSPSLELYPSDPSEYLDQRSYPVGLHDILDSSICRFAYNLGIDTIILQHEVGEINAVTEILDTRLNSYDHLISLEGEHQWFDVQNPKYIAIWFLNYGFITRDQNGQYHEINDYYIDSDDMNLVKFI